MEGHCNITETALFLPVGVSHKIMNVLQQLEQKKEPLVFDENDGNDNKNE